MIALRFLVATIVAAAATAISACSNESARRDGATDTAIVASPSARSAATPRPTSGTGRSESLPPGVKLEGGATIPNTDYVFRRVSTPRGGAIWLDSMTKDGSRAPVRIRRAELAVPPLAADERMMLASCDVKGRLDPFVVAIVVSDANVSRFSKIRQAWRANPRTGTFDIMPVAGIVCEDPGS